MNKLRNNKTVFQGIKFDSEAERDYYKYLLSLQANGTVRDIVLQPVIVLIPEFHKFGKTYRKTTYTPDFKVVFTNGEELYIDVKGFSTQQGELRRKLFTYQNDIRLNWVAKSKKYSETGWIDYDELQRLRREAKKNKDKAV